MALRIAVVDAFTDTPFAGNPAAVCVLPENRNVGASHPGAVPYDETWMKHVAREMNLSETAFLRKEEGGYQLRWFTPAVEVDLCGHATLASAHHLWEQEYVPKTDEIRFSTKSGLLTATSEGSTIELDFPATPPVPCEAPNGLFSALGLSESQVYKSRFDYLVEVPTEKQVRDLTPRFAELRALGVRGVMVTAKGEGVFDVVSRFFAPGAGIDEDPVTGSAHCCIGPYWAVKLGKETLHCFQASARGGVLRVRIDGDRVKLRGQAVTVMRGELLW